MNSHFNILFPALMIVAPALLVGLWCLWTGTRGLAPLLLATLLALCAFGGFALSAGPAVLAQPLVAPAWGMLPFFGLLWGFGLPVMRRAVHGLPPPPKTASLRPRGLELFPGAFLWPLVAWAGLVAAQIAQGGSLLLAYLGPALGLGGLAYLRPMLRLGVLEPEPLGGTDPAALARAYARFRRRRTALLYWLCVTLSLGITASGLAFDGAGGAGTRGAMIGALGGAAVGVLGAVFGTWCDAQRYLLRLQASGAQPPGR
ncbi:MAG: hypothetical protein ACT4PV_14460 [Planctomycetaceae bacterium]